MKRIFIAIIALCFYSAPSTAYGCGCPTVKPAIEFNNAKAVFIGRMLGGTEKLPVTEENGKAYQLEAGAVRFTVEERFKGKLPNEVIITVDSMRETNCGSYGLKRGELYVVYAYEGEIDEKLLSSGHCTRTATVDSKQAKEDLKFLRNLPPVETGGNLKGNIWADLKKASGDGDKPLSNVKIKIQGEDGQVIEATTDKDGKFEVKKIKAGKYRVEPQLSENYYVKGGFEEVEVDDRGTADVTFVVYFAGKVKGYVVDKNGVGFNSAFLHFLSIDEGGNQKRLYGYSDGENGEFSVKDIPPGEYVLSLNLKKNHNQDQKYYYPGTFKREEATIFKVGLGEKVEGIKFILPDEFQVRSIEGQAFWQDGKPANGVQVILLCPLVVNSNFSITPCRTIQWT